MGIFQKSVINKHLLQLDKEQVDKAFDKFKENYSVKKIFEIKQLKEEEYQDGFLREIFVDVFGYTLKPAQDYNLAREFKNQTDGKKADGAILKDGKAIVVIELKSTKTKDLTSITQQAFNYKNNQPDCKYVITSNFQKLRFYIDYANEYEEFDLFNLQKEEFDLLYLILHKDSIFSDLPLTLKKETKFHEQNISDKLYKDYSTFKSKLFENLIENNPGTDKLTLFKKSQKLLDRFLFILFAEDSGLLPPNSISRVIKRYEILKNEDAYKPLYDIFKQYFGYMNIGRKGQTEADNIPAYNGGLFYTDALLDSFKIDDEILNKDLLNLSEYDFNTYVDVNILGHIFEHSLGEIEEIIAEIEGTAEDKTKSKRKKDGVFYTPKYITQYIVENTVGKLCTEKRAELNITEIEFDGTFKTKDGKLSAKGKKLFRTLENYKNWLITLKIIDPACGSGAFLNQALNFLIDEHKQIDDIIAELTGEAMRLFDTDKAILENNLYGVDINEESVEIAKLSLWLRTAQKGRKLSNLNQNIKCGNSLIDDPEIVGDKAFNWNTEFPQIFHEKNKKIWHITTATYNSRYSQRMFDNNVKTGEAEWIDKKDEVIITKTIADIVKESKFDNNGACPIDILEYNICGDHMHLLLVCEEEELTKIVGKIKSMTSRSRNIAKGYTEAKSESDTTRGHAPLSLSEEETERGETQTKLWTQKFGKSEIKDENYLNNAIEYIRNNRIKHELPENKEIEKLKKEFLCTTEHALRTEYNGGFDCVIGNPPYIKEYTNKQVFDGLHNHYCYQGKMDLWYFFGSLALEIVKKDKGLIGYIAPNNWITNSGASKFRNIIINNAKLIEFIDFGDFKVFDTAGIQTMIYIMKSSDDNQNYSFDYSKVLDKKIKHENAQLFLEKINDNRFEYFKTKIEKEKYINKPINFINSELQKIISQIKEKQNYSFDKNEIATGIDVHQDFTNKKHTEILGDDYKVGEGIFNLSQQEYDSLNLTQKEKELVKPFYTTNELGRFYGMHKNNLWVIYTNSSFKKEETIKPYPNIKKHLDKFKSIFTSVNKPYGLHRSRDEKYFKGEKIFSLRKCSERPRFTYTNFDAYVNRTFMVIKTERINQKYLTGLLNSTLFAFWLKLKGKMQGSNYQIDKNPLLNLPIIKPSNEVQNKISDLVSQIIENKQKQLDYSKLLGKAKSKNDFDREIQLSKALDEITSKINQTDKEIDQMVYELYGLSEEEIKIVEESVN